MNSTRAEICLRVATMAALTLAGCGGSSMIPNPAPNPVPSSSRFLYVVDSIENSVSGYSIAASSGALTPIAFTPVTTGDAPIYAAASANGKFLYAANAATDSSSISGFVIDQTSGALRPTSPATLSINGDTDPLGIVVDAASAHVYTANAHSISAFNIDSASGALSDVTGTPVRVQDTNAMLANLSLSPNSQFLYATDSGTNQVRAYTINVSGLPVPAGNPVASGDVPAGIAVDHAGKYVYVVNWRSDNISTYTIAPSTGALTSAATVSLGAGCEPQELAIDPSNTRLYVSCFGLNTVAEFRIDSATGALAPMLPPFSTGSATGPRGIAIDASGQYVYTALNTQNRVGSATIGSSGTLTAVNGAPATGRGPLGLVLSGQQ